MRKVPEINRRRICADVFVPTPYLHHVWHKLPLLYEG